MLEDLVGLVAVSAVRVFLSSTYYLFLGELDEGERVLLGPVPAVTSAEVPVWAGTAGRPLVIQSY